MILKVFPTSREKP